LNWFELLANPVKDGKLARDPDRIRARQEVMVKNVIERGNVGAITK
jgi:hypothetical protein